MTNLYIKRCIRIYVKTKINSAYFKIIVFVGMMQSLNVSAVESSDLLICLLIQLYKLCAYLFICQLNQ